MEHIKFKIGAMDSVLIVPSLGRRRKLERGIKGSQKSKKNDAYTNGQTFSAAYNTNGRAWWKRVTNKLGVANVDRFSLCQAQNQ